MESGAIFSLLELTHFSYDSPWNSWYGGGGAQRDWEILRRLPAEWNRSFVTARVPGMTIPDASSKEPGIVLLGSGARPAVNRLRWALAASRRLSSSTSGVVSASPSLFAPVLPLLWNAHRSLLTIHHLVGREVWGKAGLAAPFALWYQDALLRRGRHFVCVNHAVEARIAAIQPGAKIHFVPNGFESTLLETPIATPERPTVAFLGRIDFGMKGLDRLVAAWRQILSTRPDALLRVAGRGPQAEVERLTALLATLPRESVEYLGPLEESDKGAFLAGATLFCSPSRFEGWCIAAMEAQACGLPVVATDADGFRDSVEDGRTGVLVANREATVVEDLSRVLLELLGSPERLEAMRARARERARAYSWEAASLRQGEIIAELDRQNSANFPTRTHP